MHDIDLAWLTFLFGLTGIGGITAVVVKMLKGGGGFR